MVLRDLAAASFTTTGGSAFTNVSRPLVSTVLAIWALAAGAKEPAHKANAPRYLQAVVAKFLPVRFVIVPCKNPIGKAVQRYCHFVLRAALPRGSA